MEPKLGRAAFGYVAEFAASLSLPVLLPGWTVVTVCRGDSIRSISESKGL